ncbi:alpha-2-macroglobulin [Dokdonella sp.]|uniref:alpha-2-macroglobulin family protein n=1 Tax=Dokdonella sp. TaxID=2291710 RepID=UPI001B19825E|nr:alpha-2-macroglobulin [Dokdonella sp.]MBO9663502.1 alpha-2-macroglobulin family protein [Dokdonella sp.]
MELRSPARLLRHVALVLLLALTACHRQSDGVPDVQGKKPVAAEPAQKAEQPQGFALTSARPEQYQGQLMIALEFSQPLVGTQAFDTLIAVTDASGGAVHDSWALDEDGRTLRLPYVKADQNYSVRVKGELAAADGKTLGSEVAKEVYTGPMQPAVGFASQGSVLPARETRGLPVVSVNVKEVDVEFLRVHDKELANFFAAYQKNGKRSSYELDASYWYNRAGKPVAQIAESVYSNRFALSGKENERTLNYLPTQNIAELSQPGLYFAVMKRAGSFDSEYETSFFFVSDIGVHTRAYEDALFVHTASLKTGEPLAGVELSILDAKGETVVTGKSGADGNAQLAYALKADQVLVARSGKDVSLLPFNQPALDLSDFAVAGRKQTWFEVFGWSDRDLYRPGETIRLSALLRDHDGNAIKPQPLFVTLKQPDGRPYAQAQLDPKDLNYFEWSKEIPVDAPTGRWQVEFRTDPKSTEAAQGLTFRIEEFLPERLKLDLATQQDTLKPGEALKLDVEGDYLYGAPASGNRFTARLTLAADQHPVDAHKDYYFGDPAVELPKEAKDVADEALDEHGKLALEVELADAAKAGAPVAAIVAGSVYESGGRTVTRSVKRTVWPAEALVGVRPLFDLKDGSDARARAGFELIRSDAKGELLAGQKLKLTLVREHRDYRWTFDNGTGWHFDYTDRYENTETRELDVEAGKSLKFDVPVEWGNYRVEILDPATGLTTRLPFFAGWSWNDDNRGKEARPDKIKLALDKPSYRAGDTLKVTVTPPQAGPGLLIVESDHLLYTRNIDAKPGATYEIPVTEDWERHDVYVTAVVFRGGSAVEKITPARAVGEAFVAMDRSARKIEVAVDAPKQMKPETDLPVTVKAPALAGKKAYVTVSAVDVGILNITRFARPDANAWFFAQRALGVDAYDLYGRVIESFDGVAAKLRYGGDMALASLPQARRPTAKVLTVDLFSGVVALDAKGEAEVRLAMPDFNGTVRVTALVFGENQYGGTDTETIVRAPLVAEISTPRVLAPGDQSALTLDLQNFSGNEREFAVKVAAERPLSVAQGERKVKLADGAKTTLNFPLTALDGYGVGKINVTAAGGDIKIDRHFEMVVRAAWPSVLRSTPRTLDKLEPVVLGGEAIDGLLADSVNARMTISSLPPLPFAAALKDLLKYPYGCIEQTTSKGFAALLLDEQTAANLHVDGLPAEQRKARVDGAIGRIASMQIPSGHYSMWGGDSYVNEYLTPYVVEFLEDARDDGFLVPDDLLQKSLKRLNDDLLSGGHPYYNYEHSDHLRFADQAHSGFVLARVNRAPLGTLRALFDNDRGKSITALPLVHLGIALKLMGDQPRAEKAIEEAFAKKIQRPWYLGDYGSDLRDTALMIALVHRYGLSKPEYDGRVFDLARTLTNEQRQADDDQRRYGWRSLYLSTQEQIAIARLGKTLIKDGDKVVAGTLAIGANSTEISPERLWSRSFSGAEAAAGVRFTPQGDLPLYVSTDVAGVPKTAPAANDRYVAIQRRYYTLDGKPWEPKPLKEGDSLIVGLKLEAREAMPDALLVDLLPGGLEIENFNLTDAKQWADVVVDGITITDRAQAADVRHEEFRDDRYVAALRLDKGQKANVFYLVRAVSPGTFQVPPPLVEDMYKPEVRGIGKSVPESVKVVEP